MCGICGIYDYRGVMSPDRLDRQVRAMCDSLVHRGPDDFGLDGGTVAGVVFGQRRLSIIDTSSAGRQPLFNEDRSIAAVINGEIYNFPELRTSHEMNGHRFFSHTDVEVVVHAYEDDPVGFVSGLRGMFALAIADRRKQCIVLARDALGIKPLYLYERPGWVAFASEIGAFFCLDDSPRLLSSEGVADFLLLGSIPAPRTHLQSVRALQAGEVLRISTAGMTVSGDDFVRSECRIAMEASVPDVESTAGVIRASVKRHMVSDVPIGVFLSGGIDSGAIAGMATGASSCRVRSVSVTVPGDILDEADYAKKSAELYGTEHTEVPLTRETFEQALPGFFRHLDMPSIDGLNSYVVSQAARRAGLTVALSGLGGDELFAGYPTFEFCKRLAKIMKGLGPLRHSAAAVLAIVGRSSGARRVAEVVRSGPCDLRSGYLAYRGLFVGRHMERVLTPFAKAQAQAAFDRYLEETAWVLEDQMPSRLAVGALETSRYMRHQLLRDTDALSMANTLEVRVPLVDREVVRAALPHLVHELPGDGHPKWVLRQALFRSLPSAVVQRKKQGFVFPWHSWLRGVVLTDFNARLDAGGAWESLLDRRGVQAWRDAYLQGRCHWSPFWGLYVLMRLTGDPGKRI